jgi:spoIIIJ-associated protein
MNSFERRIIHNALTNFKGIKTLSEGEEPNRHVIIKPTE